ncbi:MAG: zinc metallopeptidase [Blautia sp.]|nr:zinc metallopeptidase [Blautia sp.]
MEHFAQLIREASGGNLTNVSTPILIAMAAVGTLLLIASIVALVTSIMLAVKYVEYNRRENTAGLTGEEIAREVLQRNGLTNIKVSSCGSFLFGNSYSHFFKKVRLRRRTWKKSSISSLAMATQKSSLAVLDNQNDPDMRARVKMTPIIYLGPLAFIPLVIVGSILDLFVFKSSQGTFTIIVTAIAALFYLISFIMSLMTLKTERKAQKMALNLMRKDSLATEEEIEMCRKLYHLYNIEYVNNMIIALLEMIYRVLQIVVEVKMKSE